MTTHPLNNYTPNTQERYPPQSRCPETLLSETKMNTSHAPSSSLASSLKKKNKKALEEKLLSFFPGGIVMTRTVVGELYKVEGLVPKSSEDFNLLEKLQDLDLLMKE